MKTISILIGLLAALLFSLATPLSKIMLSNLNGFQLAGLLYIGAALAFIIFIIKNWKNELTFLKQSGKKKHILGVIFFGGILGPLFLMLGLKTANAMSVSVWLNMELVATAILGALFFKDHLDFYSIIGLLFTLCAGIIVSTQETSSGLLSGLFILLACFSWGVDNHLTAIIDGVSPQTITFLKGIFGGFTNLLIGMFLSNWEIHLNSIPAALLVGIFSYGVSILLYVISAQNLGATRSQILFSTVPFWGIFASFLFLGEPFSFIIFISFGLLILGIIFSYFTGHMHEHSHEEVVHIHLHSHDDQHHGHMDSSHENTNQPHSHIHTHKQIKHSHRHYPDMHHRHWH